MPEFDERKILSRITLPLAIATIEASYERDKTDEIEVVNPTTKKLTKPGWVTRCKCISIHFALIHPGITVKNASHFWQSGHQPKITIRHLIQVLYSSTVEGAPPREKDAEIEMNGDQYNE
ncbi:hypothetical protein T11_662 [Trichinella zimbabwensis]|uniref:Uncharacterized protein n=1 Tax=Trichinella zimbabwensis TaxID=268475 RepID=A0A0V1I3Q1_9BILA|nr:hypothetical protein T11_662 [Trichinella zimbabwensis]